MKKITAVLLIAVLLLSSLSFSGCGKKEPVVTENTGKLIVIEAKRASEGNFLVTGTLEVADGEKIAITSRLKKGEIKIEILSLDGLDDSSTVPDLNGAGVIMIGNMVPGNAMSGTMEPGDYMLRATVTEKATGTINIEVLPAD